MTAPSDTRVEICVFIHPVDGAALSILRAAVLFASISCAAIKIFGLLHWMYASDAALPWPSRCLFGRRRVLRFGLGVFAIASLLGGLGINVEMLVISRALQGIGAALIAPNAPALIATTFPVGAARNKAMAVYGAMSALGITLGVLLGGVLTVLLSWRWVFFINIPIGLAVLAGTRERVKAPVVLESWPYQAR